MKRYWNRIWLAVMSLAVLFAGCGQLPENSSSDIQVSEVSSSEPEAIPVMVEVSEENEPESVPITGEISLGENEPDALNEEQLELIADYFLCYFQSLAYLSPQDPSSLFADDASGQVQGYLHLVTFEVLTGIRAMQPADLSLAGCSYTITIEDIVERETGELMVYVSEDNIQNFAYLPDVDAETLNMGHAFYMKETDEGWKLTRHWQNEDFHFLVSDQFLWNQPKENGSTDVEAGIRMLEEIREAILADARSNLEERESQLVRTSEPVQEAGHPYDREAAIAYSEEWIGKRNPQWAYYDEYGGNCNNYASQVLFAGGIPMDIWGDIAHQWKWYGETVDARQIMAGRSPSWAGVEEFYQYVTYNIGTGITVDLDAGYFEGQPGDLLQFGAQGDWKHTVVIKEVVTDENGEPIDYLINSNTADRRNYPAMAYVYTDHRLIRVLGWDE